MSSERKLSAALGSAFLFQATTSLISGMIPMSLIVPGNIDQSMINIAGLAGLMRANFLGDLITAVGVSRSSQMQNRSRTRVGRLLLKRTQKRGSCTRMKRRLERRLATKSSIEPGVAG